MANLTAERRNRMAQILLSEGSIKVGEMADRFAVSTETIRKDIIHLEEKGIAEKSFGGAIAKVSLVEKPLNERALVHAEDKAAIAACATELIHDRATLLLDAGSTTNAIAKQLLLRKGLTIITNSLELASILSDAESDIFLIGGHIRRSSHALVGGWSTERLQHIHADLAFIGSDGFQQQAGPTCLSYEEASVKSAMLHAAAKTYVVADSSKALSTAQFAYADWPSVSGIITAGNHVKDVEQLLGSRTSVILAPPLESSKENTASFIK